MPRKNERGNRQPARHLPTFISPEQRELRVKCRCGKVAAASEEDARRLYEHVESFKGTRTPVRFYQCAQGGPWHWTRMLTVVPHYQNGSHDEGLA